MKPGYLLKKSNVSMDSSLSESRVYGKHRELSKLRKALVPNSTRRKFMTNSYFHARYNDHFDRFYNTSPHRKIQKLREARQYKSKVLLRREKTTYKSSRSIRENNSELLTQACNQCLDYNSKKKIKDTDSYFKMEKDRTLSMFHENNQEAVRETIEIKKRLADPSTYISIYSKFALRKNKYK